MLQNRKHISITTLRFCLFCHQIKYLLLVIKQSVFVLYDIYLWCYSWVYIHTGQAWKICPAYTLRVTSQASYSPEYTTPTQQILWYMLIPNIIQHTIFLHSLFWYRIKLGYQFFSLDTNFEVLVSLMDTMEKV
jgi:hypothetical protein